MTAVGGERKGLIFCVLEIILAGLFPVVTKYGVGFVNPIFFAAISALVGAGFMLVVLRLRGELKKTVHQRRFWETCF
jgi:uncharacterized membrane protein